MNILPLALGTLSGICIATGIIFLFTGLRRPGRDRVQILFSLFAFSYAGANLTSIIEYKSTTLEDFLAVREWSALFTVSTLIFLLWFVSAYTQVSPRFILVGLTMVLGLVGIIAFSSPTFINSEIFGIVTATLPWGETITQLDASEGVGEIIFFLSQLSLIGFLIYACVKQWRRGKRREGSILGLGLFFLVVALVFDMLFIDSGVINFIYLGDYGFFPLLIVMALQLSNQVIQIDIELAAHRQSLEKMVVERTQELEDLTSNLRRSERQTRALLDAPPDTAMLITPHGDILATNNIGASRLGLTFEDAIGKHVFDLYEPEIARIRKNKNRELIDKKQPIEWEDERAGRFYRNRMYPVLDEKNDVESVAIFAVDITEEKKILKQNMKAAAIEERSRLARDLHDAVTQTIYSASLITEVLPQVWDRNPEEGKRNLTKLRALVRGALAEMRTMLFELRPTALEAADFKTLLGQLSDTLHGRTRIPVQIECDEIPTINPPVKVAFYRIAQEAINNIIKHSGATQTQIELRKQSGQISLRVWDNGRGFDPAQTQNGGFGMGIMQERAASILAEIEVESQPDWGTQVTVIWKEPTQEEPEV